MAALITRRPAGDGGCGHTGFDQCDVVTQRLRWADRDCSEGTAKSTSHVSVWEPA